MTVTTTTRPRVEGEREIEIFDAVLQTLLDAGYDKLTFDAVAASVRVSKATLYRKWSSKAELVVEAIVSRACAPGESVDTGSLRGDLLAAACSVNGLTTLVPGLVSSMVPALHRDHELAVVFRSRFIEPRQRTAREAFARAQARGEVGADADLDRLSQILPALCINAAVVIGREVARDDVVAWIDEVVLPACRATVAPTSA